MKQTNKEQDLGICARCKKNKATMKYTDSYMSYAHGFVENICDECYDKQINESPLYKKGYDKAIKDVFEFLSKRGFRESNYEMIELFKWLRSLENETNKN